MEKNWRDAKPKWVVEAAEAEMAQIKRRLSLRWPDESKPDPVNFVWGGYDLLARGTPAEGLYWMPHYDGQVTSVEIRHAAKGFKKFEFRYGSSDRWTDIVARGSLYATEYEAQLAALWTACEQAAGKLELVWAPLLRSRGQV